MTNGYHPEFIKIIFLVFLGHNTRRCLKWVDFQGSIAPVIQHAGYWKAAPRKAATQLEGDYIQSFTHLYNIVRFTYRCPQDKVLFTISNFFNALS